MLELEMHLAEGKVRTFGSELLRSLVLGVFHTNCISKLFTENITCRGEVLKIVES